MREQIELWYRNNNGHPLDDNRFYDIVISSIGNKVEQSTFENAIRDVNENVLSEDIDTIYMRYECLYDFIVYYMRQNM